MKKFHYKPYKLFSNALDMGIIIITRFLDMGIIIIDKFDFN